jgi:hypothetical protein
VPYSTAEGGSTVVTTPTIHIARDQYHLAWDPAIEPIASVGSGRSSSSTASTRAAGS